MRRRAGPHLDAQRWTPAQQRTAYALRSVRGTQTPRAGIDLMNAIFSVDGNRVVTSPDAAGPWDPGMQHGSAPAALVVWAAGAVSTPGPMETRRGPTERAGP